MLVERYAGMRADLESRCGAAIVAQIQVPERPRSAIPLACLMTLIALASWWLAWISVKHSEAAEQRGVDV
jgi:hypothetical protein